MQKALNETRSRLLKLFIGFLLPCIFSESPSSPPLFLDSKANTTYGDPFQSKRCKFLSEYHPMRLYKHMSASRQIPCGRIWRTIPTRHRSFESERRIYTTHY